VNKIFLDINIVLDLIDTTRKGHLDAQNILKYVIGNDIEIAISEDMLSTIFYIIKDKKSVLNFFKVIKDDWDIIPFGKNVIEGALDICIQNDYDLEDVMQCLCAKENACDVLITNDRDFCSCGIECMNAGKFLNLANQ
jgi:predicted nucleic acid-binding protein